MFQGLIDIASALKRMNQNRILEKAVSSNQIKAEIIDLNQSQLQSGVDSEGDSTGEYSSTSVNVYGKTPGRITLKDTGEFYDSMKVGQDSDEFFVTGNTNKEGGVDLLDRWPDAMGLTDESLDEIIPAITEEAVEIILNEVI